MHDEEVPNWDFTAAIWRESGLGSRGENANRHRNLNDSVAGGQVELGRAKKEGHDYAPIQTQEKKLNKNCSSVVTTNSTKDQSLQDWRNKSAVFEPHSLVDQIDNP